MPESFDPDILCQLVARHAPIGGADFRFQRIPTGKFNTSYFVDFADRSLVLRIAPPDDAGFLFYERGMMAQEPEVHRVIREHTSAPIAEILAYDNSRSIIDRDFVIMERLPGSPLSESVHITQPFYDRVMYQVGQALRQIHSITADSYGYLGAHRPMRPQGSWNEAFTIMWNALVDDIVACGCYDDGESSRMRKLLDDNLRHFSRNTPSSLLHMDVWGQNILVNERGDLTGLIDLDRALWGDPEIEFAVLDYCGISEPAFWRGYGEERDTSPSARTRTLFYLLYELQKYMAIERWRNHGADAALRYKAQAMRLSDHLA